MNDYSSDDMAPTKEIKTLIKEAQLYQTQGLLKEARVRYEKAAEIVENDETLTSKAQLLEGIEKKLQSLDAVSYKVEKKTIITEISPRDRDLIKRLFSSAPADDKDASLLEGAVTLAKFGQFDRAIADFEELLENSPLRIVAAKHILRCHMALRALHDPMTQFHKWVSTGYFGKEELSEISIFINKTYGLSVVEQDDPEQKAPTDSGTGTVPQTANNNGQPDTPQPKSSFDPVNDVYVDVLDALHLSSGENSSDDLPTERSDDFVNMIGSPSKKQTLKYEDIVSEDATSDYVDYISSLGIPLKTGEETKLSVNLQTGSVVNLIVPAAERSVMGILKKGARIEGVKLNSPIAVNTGNCIVVSVARIDMGPKKGDYSVDLKIES
jgi:tetratricopeptide (TPR) repeat protein